MQQRRREAAAKAEGLAEEQRQKLLEKERLAEANRVQVGNSVQAGIFHIAPCTPLDDAQQR